MNSHKIIQQYWELEETAKRVACRYDQMANQLVTTLMEDKRSCLLKFEAIHALGISLSRGDHEYDTIDFDIGEGTFSAIQHFHYDDERNQICLPLDWLDMEDEEISIAINEYQHNKISEAEQESLHIKRDKEKEMKKVKQEKELKERETLKRLKEKYEK